MISIFFIEYALREKDERASKILMKMVESQYGRSLLLKLLRARIKGGNRQQSNPIPL
jgi:hypothetical protein